MAPCVRFSLLGKAVARLIGFCPVCVSWQNRSVTAPFGHRLSDELSEIILDYLHFDHRLTTTVQWHYKMLEKPVVTTNNGLFPVLAANVQNQQNSRFNASLYCPVVVLRRQVPGVRIPSGAPQQQNPNFFPIGEGFGFFVFFGKQNESLASIEKRPRPYHKKARQITVRVP